MNIDHVTIHVTNYDKAKAFYTPVFESIGGKLLQDMPEQRSYGYGETEAFYWISEEKNLTGGQHHIAIAVPTKEAVQTFYDTALAHGATDHGAPGPRPKYSSTYYGAFVITPE